MKILIVRHGETAYNAEDRISGHADIPLNEKGIRQAEALIRQIPDDIDIIYSSDLLRCKQTTDIVNARRVRVVYDLRLRERAAGSLEGKKWTDVDPDGEMKKMNAALKYDFRQYGGESVEEVRERVLACLADIKNTERGKKVVVVTSAGIIRILHQDLHGELHEKVHNSSIHEFDLK